MGSQGRGICAAEDENPGAAPKSKQGGHLIMARSMARLSLSPWAGGTWSLPADSQNFLRLF